jgi:hypothetical protein
MEERRRIQPNPEKERVMSRKSLSRTTAEALGPIVVPLVTKVALPIAIESLRRGGRFDTERFYEEAKESLANGFKKTRSERDDLKEQLADRGSELYKELRSQGADLLEKLSERGSGFADEWMDRVRPRKRGFRFGRALVILAVVGAGIAVLSNLRD